MLSFLRKISIGGKIRDGLPTGDEMEVTEGYADGRNRALVSRSDTELKESVYGKFTLRSRIRDGSLCRQMSINQNLSEHPNVY